MPLSLRSQRGFTTVTLMGVLLVGGLLVAAGFAAVNPDISLSRSDQDTKQAFGSAEAGLQWYLNRLGQDNSFYVHCTNVPDPNATENAPVNQRWSGSGSDPRRWRKLPGEDAKYTVELMPAPGFSSCIQNNQYSMIDANGNMKVRITGKSRGQVRTVLATLRRRNFIDFIYFTNFETLDPVAKTTAADVTKAQAECATYRDSRTSFCTEIQFAPGDVINGPLHTNDNMLVCGSPTFGRNSRDAIEVSGTPPYESAGGSCGSPSPNMQGTLVNPAQALGMPPSNAELANIADTNYRFYGKTSITFNDDTMTVDNADRFGTVPQTMSLPPNGVIYVFNKSCTAGYSRSQTYPTTATGCGDVWIKGRYGRDLTIGAANDIVINGNLTRQSDGLLLGLIANNFVRVYHPVNFNQTGGTSVGGCTNKADYLPNLTIHAAILALQHSFIVDNWYCGEPTADLNVDGAIAQKYRGPVGTGSGGTIVTGYRKQYTYNDRLRYREPPYFLDPVQASWRISRETEQEHAVKER
jgi:type II secretory pathway pseudopilin PulG